MSPRYLAPRQILKRMRSGDLPERLENYAAFRSDGAKARLSTMKQLELGGQIVPATPTIGGAWVLMPTEGRIFRPGRVQRTDAGGALLAPVDQHGVESGDSPSYNAIAVQQRCDELNRRGAK